MILTHKVRPAIAMIELIFAIVIMGITLLSAPMLITQSAKSNVVVLQQESIAMIGAHTNALMTFFWDDANVLSRETILTTTNGDSRLDGNNGRLLSQSRGSVAPFHATSIGQESTNSNNDVDDFTANPVSLVLQDGLGGASDSDYIDKKIIITTAMVYANDRTPNYGSASLYFPNPFNGSSSGTSNIKLITTVLKTDETGAEELANKEITLKAFMCNIGGATLQVRAGL